ncbi:DUF1565 domain-containing protein [Pendulispora rubella]|uniref:DUF1565 domain-containing protein n=1 Tax=Pendulispora rubella TaxID=2741070 RepID=A0ABZ2LL23_9BACT
MRLDEVSSVVVGDGPNALQGAITSKTPSELTFIVVVRHGSPIGPQTVKVMSQFGSATFAEAVFISPITAAPTGSDSFQMNSDLTGTDERPLRSFTRAMKLAAAGDTVLLKNGTYDAAHGETFPETSTSWNVPDGVMLMGESRGATIVQGPKGDCDTADAFVLAGSASIETITIAGFCNNGISTLKGVVTIRDVTIVDTTVGVNVETSTVLDSVDISGANIAISNFASTGTLAVTNSRVHGNRLGIDAPFADAALVVTASEIDHNCPGPANREDDGSIVVKGPAALTDVNIHHNLCPGVTTTPTGLTGQLAISRGVFALNEFAAIKFRGPGRAKVRESSFGPHPAAIYLASTASIDLGTPEDPGNNGFSVCDKCDAIFDARPAPTHGSNPTTVKGISWNRGGAPLSVPTGCFDADEPKGRTSPPRLWHIEHPGSCASATGNIILN